MVIDKKLFDRLAQEYHPIHGSIPTILNSPEIDAMEKHGLDIRSGLRYLIEGMGADLSEEMRGSKYSVYKKEFFGRAKRFTPFFANPEQLMFALLLHHHLPPSNFEEKMKTIRMNLNEIPKWKKRPDFKIGQFTVKHGSFHHSESALCWEIYDPKKKLIATAGFNLYHSGNKKVMGITTVQGELGAQPQLKQLTAALGGYWRVGIAKKLIQHGLKEKHIIEGHMPVRFWDKYQSQEQYEEAVRMTKQTYKKAGLAWNGKIFKHHVK